jgi:hypothetical protein
MKLYGFSGLVRHNMTPLCSGNEEGIIKFGLLRTFYALLGTYIWKVRYVRCLKKQTPYQE